MIAIDPKRTGLTLAGSRAIPCTWAKKTFPLHYSARMRLGE
jgi:hypothetical protein